MAARQAASAGGEAAAEPTSGHNRTWAAYQQKREAKQRNVALERFKFWLGLPNRCVAWGGGRVTKRALGRLAGKPAAAAGR